MANATIQTLAPFPPERPDPLTPPAFLAERGFSLRAARTDDLSWLRALYASTRVEEMAQVPWPQIVKRSFLDQQFALQHQHYLAHFAEADFLAIEHIEHGPVGRYYLLRTAPEHLLVDISLFPKHRSRGIGRQLIEYSQAQARAAGCGMHLHVLHQNVAARRLYERLGFLRIHDTPTHHHMRWIPTEAGAPTLS